MDTATYPKFQFSVFNPRRYRRGVEAAELKVSYSDDPEDFEYLWMSETDLRKNCLLYPEASALKDALYHYVSKPNYAHSA